VKTLLVLRHGKSDWDADDGNDHERPLAKRGIQAAKIMGRWLATIEQVPDRVITSSAVRAHETVRLAAHAGAWPGPLDARRELYDAAPEDVLRVVRSCENAFDRVLVAGHEPTSSALVGKLTGGSTVEFPTAALARIDFPVAKWADVSFGGGVLAWLVTPRLLGKAGL